MTGFNVQIPENYSLKAVGFSLNKNQQKKINQIMDYLYEISPFSSKLSLELENRGENYLGKIEIKGVSLQKTIKKISFDPIVTTIFLKEELESEIINWKRKRKIAQKV